MQNLILYYRPTCPFCRKVLDYISTNNISFEMRDIGSDSAHADQLVKNGGKQQVPCLVIDGNPMYESDDIINFLKENFEK